MRLFRELFYRRTAHVPAFASRSTSTSFVTNAATTQMNWNKLIDWSLDRFVTFSSSRRLRRVRLLSRIASQDALERESKRWKQWQQRRLQAMIDYAEQTVVSPDRHR